MTSGDDGFAGAPPRPPPTGVGACNEIAAQRDLNLSPSQRLCKWQFDEHGAKTSRGKCTKSMCDFAHSLAEIRMPQEHRLYTGNGADRVVAFTDWGTADSAQMEACLSQCYRTKLTEAIAKGSRVSAHLCYDWLFLRSCTVCPRWSNCWFLHPTPNTLAQMRQYFCRRSPVNPTLCGAKKCPYAHHTYELEVPKAFLLSYDLSAAHTVDVEVICDGQRVVMPVRAFMLLDTHGRTALRLAINNSVLPMCHNRLCDVTFACSRLHIHPAQWYSKSPGWDRVQQHASYRRGSTTQERIFLERVRAETDAALFEPLRLLHAPPPGAMPVAEAVPTVVTDLDDNDNSNSDDNVALDAEIRSRRDKLRAVLMLPSASLAFRAKEGLSIDTELADDLRNKWRSTSSRWQHVFEPWLASGQMPFRVGTNYVSHPSLVISNAGGSANVYVGLRVDDGTEVAIKVLTQQAVGRMSDSNLQRAFETEVRALKVRGAVGGIVRYYGTHVKSFEDPDTSATVVRRSIVFELMEGTVRDVVGHWLQCDVLGSRAHLHACRYILCSVISTLSDLNNSVVDGNVIAHRDVKPDNVLLDHMQQVRLIDFGVSKMIAAHLDSQSVTIVGAPLVYCSPEAISRNPFAHRTSDLYSVGLLLQFMASGKEEWDHGRAHEVKWVAVDGLWRRHAAAAAVDLRNTVVVGDAQTPGVPDQRGFYDIFKYETHLRLLAHPFFWSARKTVDFLVALGTLSRTVVLNSGLEQVAAGVVDTNAWSHLLPAPLQARADTWLKENGALYAGMAWGFLRFVRNCISHANVNNDGVFLETPVFLEVAPQLATRLWRFIVRHDQLRDEHIISRFIFEPFSVISARNVPDDDDEWW